MEMFQRLSSNSPEYILRSGNTVKTIKEKIAATIGKPIYNVDIVNLDEGIIYDNDRDISSLTRPLQVMVGKPDRTVPHYLITKEPDMIDMNEDDYDPRLKMSCGHAIKLLLGAVKKFTIDYNGNRNIRHAESSLLTRNDPVSRMPTTTNYYPDNWVSGKQSRKFPNGRRWGRGSPWSTSFFHNDYRIDMIHRNNVIVYSKGPDNLFGYMKDCLMAKVADKVCCPLPECNAQWLMQEIVRKADMTEDERIFFEFRISFNSINQENAPTSTCPSCGNFCQRQNDVLPIRCLFCSKTNRKEFNFCWECKSPWFPNHECGNRDLEAMQTILNEAPMKTLDYSHIENVPSKRMCPSCRTIIEHEKMCKQMTCVRCKTQFCFSCLKLCINGRLQCSSYNQKCIPAPVQNVSQ